VWKEDKCKGVWIYLPIEKSSFISTAVDLGFQYHHTSPSELVLSKWLVEGERSRLPNYTTHYAGVGGVCMTEFVENGEKK
jgi:Nudix hydrolase domain